MIRGSILLINSLKKSNIKKRWYEKLVKISEAVFLLDSYYQNFRDARDSMDRLIELQRINKESSQSFLVNNNDHS